MEIKYHSIDGSVFDTEDMCSYYENTILPKREAYIKNKPKAKITMGKGS